MHSGLGHHFTQKIITLFQIVQLFVMIVLFVYTKIIGLFHFRTKAYLFVVTNNVFIFYKIREYFF
jgi:hypothetical protein